MEGWGEGGRYTHVSKNIIEIKVSHFAGQFGGVHSKYTGEE